jgi:hypothetical protein
MFNPENFESVAHSIPLGFVPRYQIGREIRLLGWSFIWWRTVGRYRFFDALTRHGILAPHSDIEAATILFASGAAATADRVHFRVLKF